WALYDTWFGLRGARPPAADVVVVAVDDPSQAELGRFPWPRETHARLLENLAEARVVGFDLVFDTPDERGGDGAFARAVAAHGRVVLGSMMRFAPEGDAVTRQYVHPRPELLRAARLPGFINIPTEADNVVRRVTVADPLPGGTASPRLYPSFGLAVAMAALGHTPGDLRYVPGAAAGLVTAGPLRVPVDRNYRAFVDFPGPRGAFPTYSYADVLLGRVPPETFRDRIVLIGPTSAAFHDDFPTPFTRSNLVLDGRLPVPGVEVHAAAVESFLTGRLLRPAHPALPVLLTVVVGPGLGFLLYRRRAWSGLGLVVLTVLAPGGLGYGLWYHARYWLPVGGALVAAGLVYSLGTAANLVFAELERRQIRAAFARYVGPDVVRELLRDPAAAYLGGRRQEVTVVFADVRGFTAFSAGRAPEEVVARLNEYMTAMARVVLAHGGMLDKYLGDGLMAVFGVPLPRPDHARAALAAAVEIQRAVAELNERVVARGEPPFTVGLGISSGPVVVGNVGHPDRMDYTVIGETVNLASRLEGLNKEFGTRVLFGEQTYRLAASPGDEPLPWPVRPIGAVPVRGFAEPVNVYTLEWEAGPSEGGGAPSEDRPGARDPDAPAARGREGSPGRCGADAPGPEAGVGTEGYADRGWAQSAGHGGERWSVGSGIREAG
ncbi:MAG: CHASE2 domain-containing protein, partial [Desulfotomaculales bacterium]